MKNLIIAVFLLTFSACSTLKVSYDYDKQGNFAAYKTYAFTQETMQLPVGDLNLSRFISAIDTEMSAKGFSRSDNPDVIIDLRIRADEKTEAYATTSGTRGFYGGYWRYGYGGGFSTTQINYDQYIEGTLFVNMVDASTEKIVWQGRGTKTIDEDASAAKRESNINYVVKQIFTKYPPK
jgi:hypothetical protein